MKNILIIFCLFCFLVSCKKETINNKFDVYGFYQTSLDSQLIRTINFSDPYIHVVTREDSYKYPNYQIIDNKVFSDSNKFIMEILDFKKNETLDLLLIETNELMIFDK